MLVETRVFRGEYRELHVTWNVLDGNNRAALGEELGEGASVARQDPRDLWRIVTAAKLRNQT